MKLISFSPCRTLKLPNVKYLKPEDIFKHIEEIKEADWVLFPETWQVNFLVYALKKKIFPSINSYHLGYNKVEMTRAMQAIAPEHVPYTIIKGKHDGVMEEILEELSFPFIAKDVRSAQGKGVFLIENRRQLKNYLNGHDTLYLQEYLPLDRDLRVVLVGDEIVTAFWRIARDGEFRNNLSRGGKASWEDIPSEALDLVKRWSRELGINYAGFDLAPVGDKFYFLEFNLYFGYRGLLERGFTFEDKIRNYLLKNHEITKKVS